MALNVKRVIPKKFITGIPSAVLIEGRTLVALSGPTLVTLNGVSVAAKSFGDTLLVAPISAAMLSTAGPTSLEIEDADGSLVLIPVTVRKKARSNPVGALDRTLRKTVMAAARESQTVLLEVLKKLDVGEDPATLGPRLGQEMTDLGALLGSFIDEHDSATLGELGGDPATPKAKRAKGAATGAKGTVRAIADATNAQFAAAAK